MRLFLFYHNDQYLTVLHLTPEEINLITDDEDDCYYTAIDDILDKRNIPHDVFEPIVSIDSSGCGIDVFEDDDKCPIYTIK